MRNIGCQDYSGLKKNYFSPYFIILHDDQVVVVLLMKQETIREWTQNRAPSSSLCNICRGERAREIYATMAMELQLWCTGGTTVENMLDSCGGVASFNFCTLQS